MKNAFYIFSLCVCLTSIGCNDETAKANFDLSTIEYLSFGHLYGFCQGEECIEIFRIDDKGISEDTTDVYPSRTESYKGNFVLIADADPSAFESLITQFPEELLNEEETVLGCPDCADQGGYYIVILFKDGINRFWVLDTNKSSVPEYAHDYMDLISSAIAKINE